MDKNILGRKFVGRWDESVVVDVYKEGDFILVVQKNGAFQVLTDRTLRCFFKSAPELDMEDRQPHCALCGVNLLTSPVSVHARDHCVTCGP